jgi:hypothetical protein
MLYYSHVHAALSLLQQHAACLKVEPHSGYTCEAHANQLLCCPSLCISAFFSSAAGEPPLPELLGKDEEEWLELISSVHEDILSCEQHQHLQRYACLSQVEREFVSTCLDPALHLRPTVAKLQNTHDYFLDAGLQECMLHVGAVMQNMADTGALTLLVAAALSACRRQQG